MIRRRDDRGLSSRNAEVEAAVVAFSDLLANIAVNKFRVPEHDAAALVNDVFVSYLRRSEEVAELRPWLIGAICHASRMYWRSNAPTIAGSEIENDVRADPASLRILDSLPARVTAREILDSLSPRCREILKMRYFDEYTTSEIAERLGITPQYARQLVRKCLRRANAMWRERAQANDTSQEKTVQNTLEEFVDAYKKLS